VLIFGPSTEVVDRRNIDVPVLFDCCSASLSVHRIVDVTYARYT